MNITPRPYQTEDFASVLSCWQRCQTVIGRAATGLGKTVLLSMLAHHAVQNGGRVLVLADVGVLVNQLAEAIEYATGIQVGIEQGDNSTYYHGSTTHRIVVGTVQTQWAGGDGYERFRAFKPEAFSHLFLDECEFFLAPSYRKVVEWYRTHPSLKVLGVTATPMRSDGVSMAELFDAVAFDRDLRWGVRNGWLVPTKQAFIKMSVAFGDCDKNEEGDYRDAAIARRLEEEQALVEMARGIIEHAAGRRTIVVAPRVQTARAIADYLCGARPASARVLHGKLGDDARREVLEDHRNGDYPYLVSVDMLTKGFDDPQVSAVCMCRPTRSRRLYQQVWGRGTRPLKGVVDGLTTVEGRLAAIAGSAKPEMLMVNLVGIDEDVRDITTIDILAEGKDPKIIERAKKAALDGAENLEEALEEAERAEAAEIAIQSEMAEHLERVEIANKTRVIQSVAHWFDPLSGKSIDPKFLKVKTAHLEVFAKAGVPAHHVKKLADDPERAKKVASRIVLGWKRGLATYRQCMMLQARGVDTSGMTKKQASKLIDQYKKGR